MVQLMKQSGRVTFARCDGAERYAKRLVQYTCSECGATVFTRSTGDVLCMCSDPDGLLGFLRISTHTNVETGLVTTLLNDGRKRYYDRQREKEVEEELS